MGKRYTTTELNAARNLLQRVPRGSDGYLPWNEWTTTAEWKTLLVGRNEKSVVQMLSRVWKASLIPVEPAKPAEVKLNHAYNFCPGCGMKLN